LPKGEQINLEVAATGTMFAFSCTCGRKERRSHCHWNSNDFTSV